MEVRLSFGVVRLVCEIADACRPQQTMIGVDLGVNTLIAATDGVKVLLVSGRAGESRYAVARQDVGGYPAGPVQQDRRLAPLEAPATP